MRTRSLHRRMALLAVLAVLAVLAALVPTASFAAPPSKGVSGRYLVVARSGAYAAVKAKAARAGAKVIRELPQVGTLVVRASGAARASLAADPAVAAVATDRVERVAPPESQKALAAGRTTVTATAPAAAPATGINPDPAWDYKGLLWDFRRIGLPQGWQTTAGSPAVTVGVADTGLDFTHVELRSKVKAVIDFTGLEDPPICHPTDRQLARRFGGPVETDWNGHGSWIGGNIAAALNGTGMNGIAPKVNLVSLKISGWCGSAYDSELLAAFLTAADLGLDIVSISFGGYLDRSDPDQDAIYKAYVQVVRYARSKGTIIVAAAGNEHVRIGAGGRVISHGLLVPPDTKPADFIDLYGLYEVPGGVPGVVDVSATNNRVVPSSRTCPPGSEGTPEDINSPICKPRSDPHQAAGQGTINQLAYYSNYGPRIDIAAPGGARKFNLPYWDRGGTPGFPYTTADLTNVWEDFSTTSNWAQEIPCFTFGKGTGFPQGQCYTAIQGTSMATPHVSAALALMASAHPSLRKQPDALVARLLATANTNVHNYTQVLSATDKSGGDLTDGSCRTGYCHLGGPAVSDDDAYGAGLVNVANP
jgi:lantibiotic leader peptide-processing serine protease